MNRLFFAVAIAATASGVSAQAPAPAAAADSAYAHQHWIAAETSYRAAVGLDSMMPRLWYRLAITAEANHHLIVAAKAMRRAIALKTADPLAQWRLARLEAELGHRDTSAAILQRMVLNGSAPAGSQLAATPAFAWLRTPQYRALLATADSLAHPCESSAKAHQLDFWIGEWDVTPWNGPPTPATASHGHNDVHPIMAHCVISENWTNPLGGEGKSMNWYDTNLNRWRQAWMADGGGPLDYVGDYRDGAMRFEGWTLNPDGTHLLQKLTFFNVAPDTVRQLFEQSADSGKTWKPTFDGRYVRIKRLPPRSRP